MQEKLESRVTVSGFLGNTSKDVREAQVKAFLDGLGTMANYRGYSVFAKGATGTDAIIQFESRDKASQFIRDNLNAIKQFKTKGQSGESRELFFNLRMDEGKWKVYHATRLLAIKISDSKAMDPMVVKGFKYRGIISIHDFDIIKVKMGPEGMVEYKFIKQNVKDIGVNDIESKLKVIVDDFAAKFH